MKYENVFIIAPLTYMYSRLAWLYIHKRSLHDKLGPVSRGGGNVIHDFWYLGKEGEGDKIVKYYSFHLFTLTMQCFNVFFFNFSLN